MDESLRTLVVGLSAGLALLVIGGHRIVFPGSSLARRLGVAGIASVLSGLGAFAMSDKEIGAACLLATPTAIGLLKLMAQPSLVAAFCRGFASLQRPGLRALCQIVGGVTIAVGGVGWYEWESDAEADEQEREMLQIAGPVRSEMHESGSGRTDAGRRISYLAPEEREPDDSEPNVPIPASEQFFAKLIRTGPDGEISNCFGWVFTGGRYWLSQEAVEWILEDNGYQPISLPQVNDVAIYRNHGKIVHAAIVRGVDPELGVIVEGKWGRRGVFMHFADQSGYGAEYTFYRSSRSGHVLKDLQGSATAKPGEH